MKKALHLMLVFCLVSVPAWGKTLDLFSSFGTEADTLGEGVQEFADRLEDISSFDVRILSPGDLGIGQADLLNLVGDGTIDMAILIIDAQDRGSESLNREVDLYGESFPFGLQMEEYLSWHYDGGGLALLEDILKEEGDSVIILPVIAATGQAAGMFKNRVTRARFEAESPGFLMRTFGFGQAVFRKAYPNMRFITAVPGTSGEAGILNGFAQDLEGAEFDNPQIDFKAFFVDPSPNVQELGVTHYYISAWQSPATLFYLVLNKKFFEDFNDTKQNLIRTAALASTQESYARLLQRQGPALKNIQSLGIKVRKFPQKILKDLRVATEVVLEEMAADNDRFDEVLESMKTFVRQQRNWLNNGHIDRDFRFKNWGPDWKSDVSRN